MTTKKHYLYVLAFDADPQPVVFYVGHTNNPKRRRTEHRSSAKDTANTEYKYRWCRQLESIGVPWDFIVVGSIEDDEDAEYEWILKFARDNQRKNIKFIDDLPLTNMKAGDFLGEILNRRDINTANEIKQYRQQQADLKTINYTRTDTGITPAPISAKSQQLIEYLKASGEVSQAKTEEQRQRAEQRAQAYLKMLNDPNRQRRIQEETERLMQEDLAKQNLDLK